MKEKKLLKKYAGVYLKISGFAGVVLACILVLDVFMRAFFSDVKATITYINVYGEALPEFLMFCLLIPGMIYSCYHLFKALPMLIKKTGDDRKYQHE